MFCCGFFGWNRWGDWDEPEERPERVDEPVHVAAPPAAAAHAERDPDMRVSQAERDEVAAALARHYADGRLSLGEYEDRVAAAYEARTGRDFEPLLADLPAPVPATTPTSTPAPAGSGAGARRPWFDRTRLPVYLPRLLAVTGVLILAVGSGWWVLWLLWPALVLTSPHRVRRRHYYDRPFGGHRPRGPYAPRSHRARAHGRDHYRYDRPATRWL
jgi:hypothetical protein